MNIVYFDLVILRSTSNFVSYIWTLEFIIILCAVVWICEYGANSYMGHKGFSVKPLRITTGTMLNIHWKFGFGMTCLRFPPAFIDWLLQNKPRLLPVFKIIDSIHFNFQIPISNGLIVNRYSYSPRNTFQNY